MKKCLDWPIGVCTWSLHMLSVGEAARAIDELGLSHVHLALAPALGEEGKSYLDVVAARGWTISSTMMSFPEENYSSKETIKATGGIFPEATWERNRRWMVEGFDLTSRLEVPFLSLHIGFINKPGSGPWKAMRERTRLLAEEARRRGVTLILETGQETAEELKKFLEEVDSPGVGVNFDPANMVLYDEGDPVRALGVLAPWIRHVHVKDGVRTRRPGEWGREVPWGEGEVGAEAFLRELKRLGYAGVLAIEREAGDRRVHDIRSAVERLQAFQG